MVTLKWGWDVQKQLRQFYTAGNRAYNQVGVLGDYGDGTGAAVSLWVAIFPLYHS